MIQGERQVHAASHDSCAVLKLKGTKKRLQQCANIEGAVRGERTLNVLFRGLLSRSRGALQHCPLSSQ